MRKSLPVLILLFLLSALLASAAHPLRSYLDNPGPLPATVASPLAVGKTERFSAEARVALDDLGERRGWSRGAWWLDMTSPSCPDTLRLMLRWGNTDYGDMLDRRFTRLTVRLGADVLYDGDVKGFATNSGAYNTLGGAVSDGRLTVYGGLGSRSELCAMPLGRDFVPAEAHVGCLGGGRVSLLVAEAVPSPEAVASSEWAADSLDLRLAASPDPIDGYWMYLDRVNDPSYARLGGRYTLALVSDGDRGYDIIYVDGARTLADRWRPMMLKGRLRPTIFENHYTLEWIDSEFRTMTEDMHADIEQGAILTLSFPLLKTTLRFSKVPVSR